MAKKIFSLFSGKATKAADYKQILEDKQFFQSIVAYYPFAVFVQDKTGLCKTYNEKFVQLFNIAPQNIIGKTTADLLPAELVTQLAALDKQVLEQKQPCPPQKVSFHTPQGKMITLSVHKVPMMHKAAVVAILSVFEDITARHTQEQQLLHTRTLLQAILDHIPLGVYTRTVTGEMTYFNKKSQQILDQYANHPNPQQSEDTVLGYHTREQQLIQEGKPKEYPEETYTDGQGNKRLVHLIKVPLMHAGPEPLVLSIVEDVTNRRAQENELITTNNFLMAILDNLPIAVYARTHTGEILLNNKASDQLFQDKEVMDEKGFLPHETQTQRSQYSDREAQVLKEGKPLVIEEEPYTTIDDRNLILRLIKVPVKDANDDLSFVVTMAEDITERKKQEKRLEEVRLFQQVILDNAPIAIYAYDVNSQCLFYNQAVLKLFSGERGDFSRADNKYRLRERELFKTKQILDIPEEKYTGKNGETLLLHMVKVPVFTKEGNPFMVLTIAEDISLKKKQEQELVHARAFLQKVVDNLPVALSVKKATGQYILWNKRSEELFGVEAAHVIGKEHYRTDITKEQADFMLESDNKVFENRRELNIAQELISTPKDGVKIMHTVKTPLYTDSGEADYLLNVSEDITAKTKMEKQMREASEKNMLLVENAREGIAILEDHKIIYSNQAVCRLLGEETPQDFLGKRLTDYIHPDYQVLANEKHEAIINQLPNAQEPALWRFVKTSGEVVDIEVSAMVSKYLGRRIVITFLRDVTAVNKTIRQLRGEWERFKNAFECAPFAAAILNSKGYIQAMNKAARDLFHFTTQDRNFYRSVYMRPALSLEVRRRLSRAMSAEMDCVFDFKRLEEKFPGRVHGEGTLALHLSFEPFNVRNNQDGTVEADCLVTIRPVETEGKPKQEPAQSAVPLPAEKPIEKPAPLPAEQTDTDKIVELANAARTTTLGRTSENWMRMLNNVKLPAVMLDLNCLIGYVNEAFLGETGANRTDIEQKDFFSTFSHQPQQSRQAFEQAAKQASGNAFQIQLDLRGEGNSYALVQWDVLMMKDAQGKVEGYGLIASNKSKRSSL